MNELLELRTFGGLRVLHDGREGKRLPARPALLLAALVAARGRTVSRSELVDLIWPNDPPESALNQVHRYIGELRRVLEPALDMRDPGNLIERYNEGYRLRTAQIAVDLDSFDRLVSRARASLASGDHAEGTELLLSALDLAPQPAFADLGTLRSERPDFEAVEADRAAAAVLLADAALRAAVPERAMSAVARIAAQAPFHEVLQANYIRLLGAAGRQSEGLAHYEAVAGVLRETFGVDPGESLRAAHLEVLSPLAMSAEASPADRMSNLPPVNPSYVDPPGGEGRFDRLLDLGVSAGSILVLSGGGGFGKTTLAAHLARRLEQSSGASSIFLDLRGFDPERDPLTPDAAIDVALTQLGVELTDLGPEDRERALRTAARARPLVAVLDSARDAEQVRPLLACLSGVTVIVTTRALLQTLVVREGARLVQLDRWDDDSARELLVRRLGVTASAAAHPALTAIARACAGLPLALSIAAARCAGLAPHRWDAIARELLDGAGPLDALAIVAGTDDVRSVFASSLRALDEHTLAVFRRSALVPEASADECALAAVSGFDLDTTGRAIRVLLGSSLLRDAGDGVVGMHDLVRSYALELLAPDERTAAESRSLSYLALTARHVWSLTGRPFVGSTSAPRVDDAIVPPLADLAEAHAWSARNADWIDVLARSGAAQGHQRDVVTMRLDLRPTTFDLISPARGLVLFSELVPAASDLDDAALLAEVRTTSGFYASIVGQTDEAARQYASALELFIGIADFGGVAKTYRNMTGDAARRQEFDDALRFATSASEFAAKSGNPSLIAACGVIRLAVLGEMGRFERIVELAPDVVRVVRQFDPSELDSVLETQAFAQYSTGDVAAALETARESLALIGANSLDLVRPLATIALATASLGRAAECVEALEMFEELSTTGPLQFDTYFTYDAPEIRLRFDTAAAILARSDRSGARSPRTPGGPGRDPSSVG
jgi:DNA-binding SARP family transcriptional activator